MQTSLFFFAGNGESAARDKYALLMSAARFADTHAFSAIWTPERHFQQFGGLYPNPALTSAAIAAITNRVRIRAGSVVLPLHNCLRVAEEWSMLDNLSAGRVDVAFASGWHRDDFVLYPERFGDRKSLMWEQIATLQRLWSGEALMLPNGTGALVPTRILPRPLQSRLPTWITAQSDETFAQAGTLGYNVLTNMNYKSVQDLKDRIRAYRHTRARLGFDAGHVTVMTHAFVADTDIEARHIASIALRRYLDTNVNLQNTASAGAIDTNLRPGDREYLLSRAVEHIMDSVGLIGSVATCLQRARYFRSLGADEVACLIDFGVDEDQVLEGLGRLDEVASACLD